MIAVANQDKELIKTLPVTNGEQFGYHPSLGFVSKHTFENRARQRERQGFRKLSDQFEFSFQFKTDPVSQNFTVIAGQGCEASQDDAAHWRLKSALGEFFLAPVAEVRALAHVEKEEPEDHSLIIAGLMALAAFLVLAFMPKQMAQETAPQIVEQVMIQMQPEKQKAVTVNTIPDVPKELQTNKQVKRAVAQNLGFLGMLGRKDLKKALGGMPTQLKDASAGAGPGGTEGSGGELLVGLGQGLKRTTVGNTGTAGLGGVGTKGSGGGHGGYGNSMIGSGEGKALSSVPLSQDVILEGGLDKPVVQATIAKYLSQIRACYEEGLKTNPGLTGQVTVDFVVSGQGNMNSAQVARSSLGDATVEKCMTQKMLSWKFPNPRGGVNVKISYPFMLRPVRG